jgi:CHAT domain-containing protein
MEPKGASGLEGVSGENGGASSDKKEAAADVPSSKTSGAILAPLSPRDPRTGAYLEIMGGEFTELPESQAEAEAIKKVLNAPDASHPLQLREAASRSNVFAMNEANQLSNYRLLLFSCHGILPGELNRVTQPALVLSNPDPGAGGEGFLTMADAFGLKLNADLVTLSACNTGGGESVRGEGVMGLTRAFMYAGAPSVAVTLWSVESQTVKQLTTDFHANLGAGKSKAEALREAKLHMIRNQEGDFYRHPFFWAPLVIFGDGL